MPILVICYCLLLLIVSVIGFIRYKKLTKPFKILTFSVIVTFLLAILSDFFSIRYKNNAPILHLECITGYFFYSITFYYLFKTKKLKKIIIISLVIITVFFFINALLLQPPFHKVFPSNVFLPTQALYALFSLLLFKEMLLYPLKINITKQSIFWYTTSILFYSTTMFFNFGISNYIAEHNLNDYYILYFWYFILYAFHILIGISLLTDYKKLITSDA